jgi:two-component system OmpR family response regulator
VVGSVAAVTSSGGATPPAVSGPGIDDDSYRDVTDFAQPTTGPRTMDSVVLPAGSPLILLIADPDPDITKSLATELARQDIEVVWCLDGAEALLQVGTRNPHVVLAAADLPLLGGVEIARAIRRCGGDASVLVGVSGSDGQEAAADALAAGATACVARPYHSQALLPLLTASHGRAHQSPVLECGLLRLDMGAMTVQLRGRPIQLALREFQLLQLLMSRPGQALSREQIHQMVWKDSTSSTNTLAVHIKRLRARLGDHQDSEQIIQTVRGIGYRFIAPLE